MGTRTKLTLAWLPIALALSMAACDDGKTEDAPPGDSGPGLTDQDADIVDDDSGASPDAGTDSDAQADAAVDSDGGTSCTGKDGCYSCTPTTNLQLLNRCAEGCQKFDVKSYPSDWKPGQKLPALP